MNVQFWHYYWLHKLTISLILTQAPTSYFYFTPSKSPKLNTTHENSHNSCKSTHFITVHARPCILSLFARTYASHCYARKLAHLNTTHENSGISMLIMQTHAIYYYSCQLVQFIVTYASSRYPSLLLWINNYNAYKSSSVNCKSSSTKWDNLCTINKLTQNPLIYI